MRALTVRGWGSLAAFAMLAAVIVAACVKAPSGAQSADDNAKELARCNNRGEAALADPACQAAWRDAQSRFLSTNSAGARP